MHLRYFLLTLLFFLLSVPAGAANVYWVGGTDNWDATAGSKWSTSSGGSGGAAVPGASDTAIFDQTNTVCTITINTTVAQVTLTKGTLHTDGASDNSGLTHSWGIFSSSNANTRTLTLGNSQITITGTGSAWTISSGTCNVSTNTANITFTGAAPQVGFGSKTQGGTVTFTAPSAGSPALLSSDIFNNLTINGFAGKTDQFLLAANTTVTGTLTITGNSRINQLLFRSNTLGTPRTITTTGATVTATNTDFRDIALSVTKDFSGQTDIGDCGGNNMIFPASTTQTLTGNSANWSTASWTSRVPLPQDDVVISLTAGQTLTADMPRLGRNISFTTGTNLTLGNAVTSYGSLDFTGAGTFSVGSYGYTFESRSRSGTSTLTNNSKTFAQAVTFVNVGSTIQLADAFTGSATTTFSNGTFDANGQNVNSGIFTLSGATVLGGSGTWTATSTSATATKWGVTSGSFQAGSSTITLSDTGANAKTFAGGGQNYNNLTIPGASGAGTFTITGANSFNTLTISAPRTVTFPDSTTTTIAHLVANGDGSNAITINSSTGGTPAILKSSLDQNLTYTNPTDISFTGATWKCLTGCTPGTGVTGLNTSWTNSFKSGSLKTGSLKIQ